MASDLFISYAREDEKTARALAGILEARGWSVWWDRVIPPGKSWDEVIETELTNARAVIVIWSRHSISSRWVRTEAGDALDRSTLIPVRVDDVLPPLAFRHLQAADLLAWSGDSHDERLCQLLNALGTRVSPSGPVASSGDAKGARSNSIPEREVQSFTELVENWRNASDEEQEALIDMEIRFTVQRHQERRGEKPHEDLKGDLETVLAIARRLGLLR